MARPAAGDQVAGCRVGRRRGPDRRGRGTDLGYLARFVRIGLAAPKLDRWRHDRAGRGLADVHELAMRMPHVTIWNGSRDNPIYQVGGKSFVFFRNPRPDAVDPVTGERFQDVIVFWVPSESDKQSLVQDPGLAVLHHAALRRPPVGAGAGEPGRRAHRTGTDRGDRGRLALAGLPRQSRGLAGHPARRLAAGGCGTVRTMDDEDGYFGERVAATYDGTSGVFGPGAVEATAGVLAELADGGRALELGIGTGRIALPLARRGLEVHGIDLSRAMVARLRAKPGGEVIPVAIGDFATTTMVRHLLAGLPGVQHDQRT